jgi:hypothetical protein
MRLGNTLLGASASPSVSLKVLVPEGVGVQKKREAGTYVMSQQMDHKRLWLEDQKKES